MRWSCPHCGVNLAVTDEKLGTGWSFSRCYKCGGFALVRRSDVNLIKVDRAPTGERVLLPEGTEEPMMGSTATQNLARYVEAHQARSEAALVAQAHAAAIQKAALASGAGAVAAGKPIIRHASRRNHKENAPSIAAPAQQPTPPKILPPRPQSTRPRPADLSGLILPDPLPDEPIRQSSRALPIAIGVAGALSVASGIYLYLQGQALWHKARVAAGISHKEQQPTGQPQPQAKQQDLTSSPSLALESADRLHQSSMAPVRAENAPSEANEGGQTTAVPAKEAASAMTVTIKVRNAHVHSGPGMDYPIIGTVDGGRTYPVADWRDRWFKIVLPSQEKEAVPVGRSAPTQTAWIRNDLVQR